MVSLDEIVKTIEAFHFPTRNVSENTDVDFLSKEKIPKCIIDIYKKFDGIIFFSSKDPRIRMLKAKEIMPTGFYVFGPDFLKYGANNNYIALFETDDYDFISLKIDEINLEKNIVPFYDTFSETFLDEEYNKKISDTFEFLLLQIINDELPWIF